MTVTYGSHDNQIVARGFYVKNFDFTRFSEFGGGGGNRVE